MKLTDLIPFYHHHDQLPEGPDGYTNPFQDMEQIFEDLVPGIAPDPSLAANFANLGNCFPGPQVEVDASGQDIVVTAEIPGIDGRDLDIRLEDGGLWIRGERRRAAGGHDSTARRCERWHGNFERWVALPVAVDGSKAEASSHNGMVTVRLPRLHEANPRRIPIRAA